MPIMTHSETFRKLAASRRASRWLWIIITCMALGFGPPTQAAVEYQRLKSFGFPELAGSNPSGPLIQGSDGLFYGSTARGYGKDFGTIFKLNSDGHGYIVLYRFEGSKGGQSPSGGLLEGSDGALYGT